MSPSSELDEELSLLQFAIIPPQVISVDKESGVFTTSYRDYQLTLGISENYPNHDGEIALNITPSDVEIRRKCRKAAADVSPGDGSLLFDLCHAFRSAVDRRLQVLSKTESPCSVSFFNVKQRVEDSRSSKAEKTKEIPLKSKESSTSATVDEGSFGIEKCMYAVSFDGKGAVPEVRVKENEHGRKDNHFKIGMRAQSGTLNATGRVKRIKPMLGPYPLLENLDFRAPENIVPKHLPKTFSVMTWNILCELFDEDNRKESEKRFPLIVGELIKSKADIIALQDISPAVWTRLVEETSLAKSYFITELPSEVSIGQIVLTKHSIAKCEVLRLSVQKHAILVALHTATGRTLRVVNVQLISDYAKNAALRRMSELATIGKEIDDTEDTILLGDFNFGDDDTEEKNVPWGSFIDAWHILRGSEPGVTLDYDGNSMAKSFCGPVESSRRVDKIKIRGMLVPSDIQVTAKAKNADGLYASSHYAVKAVFMQEKSFLPFEPGVHLDTNSAVVIIPPRALWADIDALREGNDYHHPRWMPTIPLLHPFIQLDEKQLPCVINALQCIGKRFPPFRIRLSEISSYTESDVATLFLDAEQLRPFEGALQRIHAMFMAAYSMCSSPHLGKLVIGQCPAVEAPVFKSKLRERWESAIFDVTHIHVISRANSLEPFTVRRSIQLGFFNSNTRDVAELTAKLEVPASTLPEPPAPPPMVIEYSPSQFVRPKPYLPGDALEQWLSTRSNIELAGRRATHYSQKGGMYHIPDADINGFLNAWAETIERNQEFYIEEKLSDRFRLYIDIDFRSSERGNFALNGTRILDIILTHTLCFFDSCDPTACVTTCHGHVKDKMNQGVRSKTGYRIYFQHIWVNAKTHSRYLNSLSTVVGALLDVPLPCVSTSTWRGILNTYVAQYERCRLLGSSKKRKGYGRRYSVYGYYTVKKSSTKAFRDSIELSNVFHLHSRNDLRKESTSQREKALFSTLVSIWGSACVSTAVMDGNAYREDVYFPEDRISSAYAEAVEAKRQQTS
ncbi:polynucleotide Adenyltransferase [Perkinsela sp. CCAP 1560/4]|nr:polynucleotide Adenyltransferase [Perkinsela sp. CCAP 1560/4]|eukprot:KNH09658.1 polynucleotide Adenyltransferase [Perkinsela sp. CCAP 1560/4]